MISTVPETMPARFGENVTLMVQVAPAATVLPQVDVAPNAPVVLIDEMASLALPLLVRVTVWGWLVVPCFWLVKLSGVIGEYLTLPVLSRTSLTSLRPPNWSAKVTSS